MPKQWLGSRTDRDSVAPEDPSILETFAGDLAFDGDPPIGLIAPSSAEELAATVRDLLASDHPPALIALGGRTTYSAAYVTRGRPYVAVTTDRLDRISLSDDGATAVIGAGVSWAAAHGWLAERGLQLGLQGPASGLFATFGGGASTNAVGMGSARRGTLADQVAGLEVVTGHGAILRTGRLAERPLETDATRLFIGDCGAFGVKTAVAMPVEPLSPALAFGGFAHHEPGAQRAAVEALTTSGLCEDVVALEVPAIAGARPAWLLEFSAPPDRIGAALAACGDAGAEIAAAILPELRRAPCPELDMLFDADLRRWSPVHGLVTVARYGQALDRMRAALAALAGSFAEHDIRWALSSMAVGRDRILVEANLFIPGRPPAVVSDLLPAERTAHLLAQPVRPRAAAAGQAARRALIETLGAGGATHMQIGRLYPGADRDSALRLLKDALDPRGIMNPGVLGLP